MLTLYTSVREKPVLQRPLAPGALRELFSYDNLFDVKLEVWRAVRVSRVRVMTLQHSPESRSTGFVFFTTLQHQTVYPQIFSDIMERDRT